MKINLFDNSNTNFRMALRVPATPKGCLSLAKELRLIENKSVQRGLKGFIKEQKNVQFDIIYNEKEKAFAVMSVDGKQVLKSFKQAEGIELDKKNTFLNVLKSKCRQLISPKSILPKHLIKAGEFARGMNKIL